MYKDIDSLTTYLALNSGLSGVKSAVGELKSDLNNVISDIHNMKNRGQIFCAAYGNPFFPKSFMMPIVCKLIGSSTETTENLTCGFWQISDWSRFTPATLPENVDTTAHGLMTVAAYGTKLEQFANNTYKLWIPKNPCSSDESNWVQVI